MNPSNVEEVIESEIPGAQASVQRARGQHDDDHLEAIVVSPTFEDEMLVNQHQQVYDALSEHMTTDIHALELKTYTPREYENRS